jgi:hypothetical protein
VHITATRPKIVVTADGRGVAARAGSRLLVDLAEATGLSAGFSAAVAGLRERRAGHDPGRVLTDLAVLLADGGEAISDLAVLRNQPEVFGAVASTATAWRVLDGVDCALLSELRSARAAARERAWLARAELGRAGPAVTAGGRAWPGLVLDVDATLVTCHSEKEQAAPTCKGGFGYHPLLVFCDNTGQALAGVLRPGNAGANTAADHITVTDAALAQIPDSHRHGAPILVRADGAGCSRAWLGHLRAQRETGVDIEFSVGFTMTPAVQAAILSLPALAWADAIEADGSAREGAQVAELTGMLPDLAAAGWPARMRVIVRRERPHPGAQLSFTDIDGWRFAGLRHRHRRRAAGPPGGPPPRPRPGGRPDPLRQGHRLRPVPLPARRHQRRLARTRPDRHRPSRLDPNDAPRR